MRIAIDRLAELLRAHPAEVAHELRRAGAPMAGTTVPLDWIRHHMPAWRDAADEHDADVLDLERRSREAIAS